MKLQLIMLDNPILVSDEKIKSEECFVYYSDLEGNQVIEKVSNILNYTPNCKRVIAGIHELPSIDFSALSEEDCKKIGWIDADKITQQHFKDYWKKEDGTEYAGVEITASMMTNMLCETSAFVAGFKMAQSLNEKKFSEYDMRKAIELARKRDEWGEWEIHDENILKSISQPKVFKVEVEMEQYDEGGFSPERQPKITNNPIKITKIL